MINILYIYEQIDPTVIVNLTSIKSVLCDDVQNRAMLSKKVSNEDLVWCQICIAIRPSTVYSLAIVSALKDTGRSFLSVYDDDLLNLPIGNSSRWRKKYVEKILKKSDAFLSPSPVIISDYSKIAPYIPGLLGRAYVLSEDILPVVPCGKIVKILYAAGQDHKDLFDRFIKPSIDNLLDHFPNLELHLIGVSPDLSELKHQDRVYFRPSMPYNEYIEFMKSNRYDIGLSPLYDTPFCNKKYYNKFLEYAKNGIVGLYSDCLPYTLVVKDGFNGVLVKNDVDSWRDAMENAIMNIEKMKLVAEESQRTLKSDFSYEFVKGQLYDKITALIGDITKSVRYKKNYLSIAVFVITDNSLNLIYHVKEDGLRGVLRKIWDKYVHK